MGKVIGKVIATEKNPSTIDDFYFWTKQDLILNPFDVVKVNHLQHSVSYGVIEEISHITDTANFLADYVSNDFGDVDATENTHRIGMNYVKAKVIGNTGNIYIPLINNQKVELANEDEVAEALGLKNVKNPVTCGYLEMYNGHEDNIKLPVQMDSRFLIGPEGAHLNISGISGLAAKTSYAMFLLKAIQDKCMSNPEQDDDVAFVLFNVKGKDLLALDEPNEYESVAEKNATYALYEKLHMSTEPFKNVQYYYPYAENKIGNTYLHREAYDNQRSQGKAHLYKYSYEEDKDNLDLMFASMDDPQQTMDSILNYIISNQGSFGGLDGWDDFLDEVQKYCKAGSGGDKEITVNSWRKFNRIIRKSIYRNEIFDSVRDNGEEVRIGEALKHIKKDEVHVIDIAKLNEDMQGFVFGDAIRARLTGAEVVHHTRGGARLAEQLNEKTRMGKLTQSALWNEKWDYVVLQEMSNGPITSKKKFLQNVELLCKQISDCGAVPILYATWAYERDSKQLEALGMEYDEMYQKMYASYHEAAELTGALIADVGQRFYEIADQKRIYASDGCHPNEMGSIIAAETIAAVIREDQEKKNTDNTLAYYNQNVLNFICTTQSVDLYTVNS